MKRMKRFLAPVVALLTFGSVIVLAPAASAAPVTTGYTSTEYRDLTGAANYLQMTEEVLQVFGVRTIHFILGISGQLGRTGTDYSGTVDSDGPFKFTSDYGAEDTESLLVVMAYHNVNTSQAQKIGAAFMTFISGIDAAQKGVDIEKFKENPDPCQGLPNNPAKCGYSLWRSAHASALIAASRLIDNQSCNRGWEAEMRTRLNDAIGDLPSGDLARRWLEQSLNALNQYRKNCQSRNWRGWYAENFGHDTAGWARIVARSTNPATLPAPPTRFSDPYPHWHQGVRRILDSGELPVNINCGSANAAQRIVVLEQFVDNIVTAWPIPDSIAGNPDHPALKAMTALVKWKNDTAPNLCKGKTGTVKAGLVPLAEAAYTATAGLEAGARGKYLLPTEKP